MESVSARIDLQKLQLLNDRICQTLDALAQVRMSAHSTSMYNPCMNGFTPGFGSGMGMGMGMGQAFPVNPYAGGFNFGWSGINAFGFPQFVNPWQMNRPGFNTFAPMFGPAAGAATLTTNGPIPAAACGVSQGFAPVAW